MMNLTRIEENGDKDGKELCKLMSNAVNGTTMEKWKNRINLTPEFNNEKII